MMWVITKTRAAFLWLTLCTAFAAAPSALHTAIRVKHRAPALHSWLHKEFTALVPTLKSRRGEVLQMCTARFAAQWESKGLGEEATVEQLMELLQQAGTKVVVASLMACALPGTADAVSEPLAQILEPYTRDSVSQVLQGIDEHTISTALQSANIRLRGSGTVLQLRLSKADCLQAFTDLAVAPALDAFLHKLEQTAADPSEFRRVLRNLGGLPRVFWESVRHFISH